MQLRPQHMASHICMHANTSKPLQPAGFAAKQAQTSAQGFFRIKRGSYFLTSLYLRTRVIKRCQKQTYVYKYNWQVHLRHNAVASCKRIVKTLQTVRCAKACNNELSLGQVLSPGDSSTEKTSESLNRYSEGPFPNADNVPSQ